MSRTVLPYESSTPPEPPKGSLGIIFLIVLLDLMGFGIIIPLLAFYIPDYKLHPLQVTAVFSVYSICQFIGAPILGAMSDRFGRRPVLALSQAGSTIGYLLLALAAFEHDPSLRLLLVYVSRVIDGFTGGNISTAQAYVSDVTTAQNRAKGMGMLGAAFGIGFSLGPALGGICGHWNLSLPGWIAAGFSALAAGLTWMRLPESRAHKPTEAENWLHPSRFKPILAKPVLVQLLAIAFILMAAFVMMESTIALFLNEVFGWEELGVGLYFLFVGFIIIGVQGGLIGKLTKRLGDWPLCIAGPFLVSVAMVGLIVIGYLDASRTFALAITVLLVTGTMNATGRSLQTPTMSSLLSKFSGRDEQGIVFGLYHSLSSLARVIGPLVAGLAYPLLRHGGPYLIAAILALAMGFWTLSVRQPIPGSSEPEARAEGALEGA